MDQEFRRRKTDTILNGAPWWAQLILKLGVTAAIAIGLVWFLTQDVKKTLDSINGAVATHEAGSQAQTSVWTQHERTTIELVNGLARMILILQVSCVNAAKDAQARRECVQ